MNMPQFASGAEYFALADMLEETRADVANTGASLLTSYLRARANPAFPAHTGIAWDSLTDALAEVQSAMDDLQQISALCRTFGANAAVFEKLVEQGTQPVDRSSGPGEPNAGRDQDSQVG